jgi:heptosyltransferase-2
MAVFAIAFGWTLAKLPEFFCKGLCALLGLLFYAIPSKRKQILLSNLHHAFPDRDRAWLKRISKKICIRTAEMGLFTLVCPHFSEARFKRSLHASPEMEERMQELCNRDRPVMFFSVHFSMIEAFNAWPGIAGFPFPEMAIMYRPHKNVRIDQMIREHRERFGLKLVSRKTGIRTIGEVLRRKGVGAVLFDQNTRDYGTLIPFFGRVTSATELPEILTKKYDAIPATMMCYSSGFWRGSVYLEELDPEANDGNLTLTSNQWLENKIKEDETFLVDWLWTHNRWKILHRPHERLGMNHKRKAFDFTRTQLRNTRIAIFHSEPSAHKQSIDKFIKALRQSRPDAMLSMYANSIKAEEFDVDRTVSIGANWNAEMAKTVSDSYQDVAVVLEPSPKLQRWLSRTNIADRFGVSVDGKKPKGLTHYWTPEDATQWLADPDWIEFGKQFGLETPAQ